MSLTQAVPLALQHPRQQLPPPLQDLVQPLLPQQQAPLLEQDVRGLQVWTWWARSEMHADACVTSFVVVNRLFLLLLLHLCHLSLRHCSLMLPPVVFLLLLVLMIMEKSGSWRHCCCQRLVLAWMYLVLTQPQLNCLAATLTCCLTCQG
jgi:hypothetical protein